MFVLTFSLSCTQSLRVFFVVVFNSLPYYAFPGFIPLYFLNPGVWGLISFEQDLQVGVSDVELKFFDPQIESPYICDPLPIEGCYTLGVDFFFPLG